MPHREGTNNMIGGKGKEKTSINPKVNQISWSHYFEVDNLSRNRKLTIRIQQ